MGKRASEETTRIRAFHGTDRMDFTRFELTEVAAYNVGLHFGTRAAAESRVGFLCQRNSSSVCRVLECELILKNPLRVDDVFGHSYAGLFDLLERELARRPCAALQRRLENLRERWMSADDNPRLDDPTRFDAFNRKLNASIRGLFLSLGYDGLVYKNELEDGATASDSYVIFDPRQVTIVGETQVGRRGHSRFAA